MYEGPYWRIVQLVKQKRGSLWKPRITSHQLNMPPPSEKLGEKMLINGKCEEGIYALQINPGGRGHGFKTKWKMYFKLRTV